MSFDINSQEPISISLEEYNLLLKAIPFINRYTSPELDAEGLLNILYQGRFLVVPKDKECLS